MTRTETIKLLGLLNGSGLIGAPDASLVDATIAIYAEMLSDIPFDAAVQAVRAYLADASPSCDTDARPVGRWWMTIADIRARVLAVETPRILGEWDRLVKALSMGIGLDYLDARHRAGLDAVGGTWAVKHRLETDNARMRAAFVRAFRKAEAALPQIATTEGA